MQGTAFAFGMVETPELRRRRRRFQAIAQLVKQREHISLAQFDRLLHHLRRQDLVVDFDENGCAQIFELRLSCELDARAISRPRSSFPIIGLIFKAAFAVLKDCRKLSAMMVPCDGLTAIEDGDFESL